MNATHLELLRRLEQFQLDSSEAALPFSGRLAKENNWPADYTHRVIAEYKRFAYLAVVAGHPVSPSEDVDQAWHLHLTYTENYWKSFCIEVLGKPLHHQPTKGGGAEQSKFQDWYERTLESYAAHFGELPPSDIWPTAEARREQHHHFVRVDRARNWIIPRPRLQVARKSLALSALVVLTVLCTGGMIAQGAGPFDWRGPDFLLFYVVLAAFCFGLATWLRRSFRVPAVAQPGDGSNVEPYAMAYLNGGKVLTVNTAIANLANRDLLKIDKKGKQIRTSGNISPADHYLEKIIHAAAVMPGGAKIAEVRLAAKPIVDGIVEDLKGRGLVMADVQAKKATWLPLLVAGIAPLVGAIKIFIGVNRDRPVGFLAALCLASVLVALIGFARRPLRSQRGDAVLERLKASHSRMSTLRGKVAGLTPVEFATAVGLFGLIALDGTALADLGSALQPPRTSSGCGSSCGGGCGGGGCGGGCGGCGG